MDLHELHTGAEWYSVSDKKRTRWQRLAARTLGTVTPGNAVTLLGAVITVVGLWAFWHDSFILGFILIGAGRLGDIIDGFVARRTHTSSPFGEGLDAATDKLVILLAALVLVATEAVPLVLIIAVTILEIAIAVAVMLGRKAGAQLHPLRIGKYATFGLWLSLVVFLIAHAMGSAYGTGRLLYIAATVGGALAFGGTAISFIRYIQMITEARRNRQLGRKKFF